MLIAGCLVTTCIHRLTNAFFTEGRLLGRRVVHWSYLPLAVSSLVGVIVFVAATCLVQVALSITAAFLALSASIGAFYVRKFSVILSFKKEVIRLEKANSVLAGEMDTLHKENIALKKTGERIEEQNKKFQEIIKDTSALLEQEKAHLKTLESQNIEQKKELEILKNLVKDFYEKAKEFTKRAENFGVNVGELKKGVTFLEQQVKKMDLVQDDLREDITALDREGEELKKTHELIAQDLIFYADILKKIEDLLEHNKEDVEKLMKAKKNKSEIILLLGKLKKITERR
jgi:chromosome segregation ATPase